MAYRDDTGDPYVIPGTEVLRNLAGIRDAASLAGFEADMSILRQIELSEMPPSGPFDFARLKAIHRCLFQDVYAWAGEPRTIDIAKDGNRFGSHLHVEAFLSRLFEKLAAEREKWIISAASIDWADRFAEYLGEINAAHPFREGNGRCQRLFIGQLADAHGFEIRWDQMSASEMVEASIDSFHGDKEPLKRLVQRCLFAKK